VGGEGSLTLCDELPREPVRERALLWVTLSRQLTVMSCAEETQFFGAVEPAFFGGIPGPAGKLLERGPLFGAEPGCPALIG